LLNPHGDAVGARPETRHQESLRPLASVLGCAVLPRSNSSTFLGRCDNHILRVQPEPELDEGDNNNRQGHSADSELGNGVASLTC
jgi:hypothetical protein